MEQARRPDRPSYEMLPRWLRGCIDDALGSPVVSAQSTSEGFSLGTAAALTTECGSHVFVKAVSTFQHPTSARLYRREAGVVTRLTGIPAPGLRWVYDDDEWIVMIFDHCPGRTPQLPWRHHELARVVAAADAVATLSPEWGLPRLADSDFGYGWQAFVAAPLPDLDRFPGLRSRLTELLDLEVRFREILAGESLQHGDLRADNVLITDDDVWLVDWPFATIGPPWFDVLAMVPSVAMTGGPSPAEVVAMSATASQLSQEDLRAVAAGLAGFFIPRALCHPEPGLPTLRQFQADQGQAALEWLDSLARPRLWAIT